MKDYRGDVAVIEIEEDREVYLVTPNAALDLQTEIKHKTLFTAINRQGVLFLWPVPIAAADARVLEWHRSAREGAEMAMKEWVRVQANMNLGGYEMLKPAGAHRQPGMAEHTPSGNCCVLHSAIGSSTGLITRP